jgi:prepilin-type N-terminal cleavage/methylation domain-containing protein
MNRYSYLQPYKRAPRATQRFTAGFTLIETLVAVAILGLTIGGLLTVTTLSVRSLSIQKEKLIATKIAGEGIESMINKRDNNTRCIQSACGLSCSGDWRHGLADQAGASCNFGNQAACWEVDAANSTALLPNNSFNQLTNGACNSLSTSNYICIETSGPDKGKFTYCGNDPAKMLPQRFTRIVKVTAYPVSEKLLVESIVRWQSPLTGSQEERLQEVIFGI